MIRRMVRRITYYGLLPYAFISVVLGIVAFIKGATHSPILIAITSSPVFIGLAVAAFVITAVVTLQLVIQFIVVIFEFIRDLPEIVRNIRAGGESPSLLISLKLPVEIIAGGSSLVTMASIFPIGSPIRIAGLVAVLGGFALLVGKFALAGILIPIAKSIPALVFGAWFQDWWKKRHPDKPETPAKPQES